MGGGPARLVEAIVGVALLIWISEMLGVVRLLYAGALVGASVLLAGCGRVPARAGAEPGRPVGWRVVEGWPSETRVADRRRRPRTDTTRGRPPGTSIGRAGHGRRRSRLVVAHWALTTRHALDRGIFNFDSLWYHLPFAAEMVQSHSVTGMHYTDTVFTNWFYPQNSELLHAVGILLTERDTLSLFLNFGWLAVAFLAAWCIGRPYGRGPLRSSPPRSCSSATRWSCASPGPPRTT